MHTKKAQSEPLPLPNVAEMIAALDACTCPQCGEFIDVYTEDHAAGNRTCEACEHAWNALESIWNAPAIEVTSAALNCGDCWIDRDERVELVNGACPACKAIYFAQEHAQERTCTIVDAAIEDEAEPIAGRISAVAGA